MTAPHALTAIEAAGQIRDGRLSSVELVESCLARIEETEPTLRAWAYLDRENALTQAAALDRIRKAGRPVGALHGVPVGLKDIVDTKDMPTERGTPIFAGRRPDKDAAIVERLREAGAVILGKTVSTELAFVHAGATRNPHNPERTPGGSSSGSAAAVAAYNVPLAVGTQTNGSVIRPASFCGVFGFKPTRGVISRRGVLQTCESLDQVGGFARSLEDVALLCDVLGGYDPADSLSYPRPRPRMLETAREDVLVEPNFMWFDMPYHDRLASDAAEGFEAVLDALAGQVDRSGVSDKLAALVEVQRVVHEYEFCRHLAPVLDENFDRISDSLRPIVERGRNISEQDYKDALRIKASAEAFFATFFNDYDAILAPAAAGGAPGFGPATGDPVFCSIWTVAGLPCLTLPLLVDEEGMPLGLQLVGGLEEDDRLMRTANWVLAKFRDQT